MLGKVIFAADRLYSHFLLISFDFHRNFLIFVADILKAHRLFFLAQNLDTFDTTKNLS